MGQQVTALLWQTPPGHVVSFTAGESEWEFEELPATTAVIIEQDSAHRSDNVSLIAVCFLQHFYTASCLLKQGKSKWFMHHRFFFRGWKQCWETRQIFEHCFLESTKKSLNLPHNPSYPFDLAELRDCHRHYHDSDPLICPHNPPINKKLSV